jgi:HD-GYP domain-containing protein (c-di-GMP phosphodiesterase class II)
VKIFSLENEIDKAGNGILQSLLQVGISLPAMPNWRATLDMILREARKLAKAEAGTFYLFEEEQLSFVAVQNDKLGTSEVRRILLDRNLAGDSLASFVAKTGLVLNIPDSFHLPAGAPYRINRSFDAKTGYRARSLLALPITAMNGGTRETLGVLELINALDEKGQVVSFPDSDTAGLQALASMAGMTLQQVRLQQELKRTQLETIIVLSAAAEHRDDDAADHLRRVSHTASLLARQMGMSDQEAELLHLAAPLHDVGKIGIPDSILRKPGALTPEERKSMETHTLIGGNILAQANGDLLCLAREVAMCHHERWDGLGYPNHLAGEDIPLSGRIVCLADVFDALLSKRCYKPAYSVEETLEVIRGSSGKQFDPELVQILLDCLAAILEPYELAVPDDLQDPSSL